MTQATKIVGTGLGIGVVFGAGIGVGARIGRIAVTGVGSEKTRFFSTTVILSMDNEGNSSDNNSISDNQDSP